MTGSCLSNVWQNRPRLSGVLFILNLCGGACVYKEGTSALSCVSGSTALSVTTYWDTPMEWHWWAMLPCKEIINCLVLAYRWVPWKRFSDLLASANSASHSEQMWTAKQWVLKPSLHGVCVRGRLVWTGSTLVPWNPRRKLTHGKFQVWSWGVEFPPKGVCFTCFKT